MDLRTSQLVQELGLNLDLPNSNQASAADGQVSDSAPSGGTPSLAQQASSNSGGNGGGSSGTQRSRGFSNIFGGISTLEQVNGFALSRQNSVNNNNANSTTNAQASQANPTTSGPVYPVLPNTNERDLQTSLQNYNNLLEQ